MFVDFVLKACPSEVSPESVEQCHLVTEVELMLESLRSLSRRILVLSVVTICSGQIQRDAKVH